MAGQHDQLELEHGPSDVAERLLRPGLERLESLLHRVAAAERLRDLLPLGGVDEPEHLEAQFLLVLEVGVHRPLGIAGLVGHLLERCGRVPVGQEEVARSRDEMRPRTRLTLRPGQSRHAHPFFEAPARIFQFSYTAGIWFLLASRYDFE